jgi:hypothetical protein
LHCRPPTPSPPSNLLSDLSRHWPTNFPSVKNQAADPSSLFLVLPARQEELDLGVVDATAVMYLDATSVMLLAATYML